jgi:hypothetical protein
MLTGLTLSSDKKQESLPLINYTIVTESKNASDNDSGNVKSFSTPDILNKRFAGLPPEEFQFEDDASMK